MSIFWLYFSGRALKLAVFMLSVAICHIFYTSEVLCAERTFFSDYATPSNVTEDDDPQPVELGVKFRASTRGRILGIRFYKGPLNTGTHIGHLWTATGNPLAKATFTNETALGWQEARFWTPVPIEADVTYIASYFAPNGYYSASVDYFADDHRSGDLVAPSSGSAEGNGVYHYAPAPAFPSDTFNATNYWVDVIFEEGASLVASPASISEGESAVLTWTAPEADACEGTNFVTGHSSAGSTAVAPAATTAYTISCISCSGPTRGYTRTAKVKVQPADTSAPTVPTELQAVAVSASETVVHWNASSDDKEVAGYNVYRNGKKIASTSFVTYFNDKTLAASTSYNYTVSAVDTAGNASDQSSSVRATTHTRGSNVRVGDPANPAALEQEIMDAYNAGASSVTINPGTYVLDKKDGVATVTLKGLQDFVIDGYGAVISAVQTEENVFAVLYSDNIVLRGITIQYNAPQTAQGRIVDIKSSGNQYYFDVQLEDGYRYDPDR